MLFELYYLLCIAFHIWMGIDAIRRQEIIWALFIGFSLFFSPALPIAVTFYYFWVYRSSQGSSLGTWQMSGSGGSERIKELQSKIPHLDKPHHHLELGEIYFDRGKMDLAEECFRAALERAPEDPDNRAALGECLLAVGKPDEARPFLDEVCLEDADHNNGHTMAALARSEAESGNLERAVECMETVLERHSYIEVQVRLCELYLKSGQEKKARPILEEIVDDADHAPSYQARREKEWIRRAKLLLRQASPA